MTFEGNDEITYPALAGSSGRSTVSAMMGETTAKTMKRKGWCVARLAE